MSRYDDILAKLRAAEGPDRALDLQIAQEAWPFIVVQRFSPETNGNHPYTFRKFTESVDDALALAEESLPGYAWSAVRLWDLHCGFTFYSPERARFEGEGPTAPLAILIAHFEALKAKEE